MYQVKHGVKDLRKQVVAHLDELRRKGEPVWWCKTGGKTRREGGPTLCIVYRGLPVLLLCVPEGVGHSPAQERAILAIQEAGGCSRIVRSVEDAKAILEMVKARAAEIVDAVSQVRMARHRQQVAQQQQVAPLKLHVAEDDLPDTTEFPQNSAEVRLTADT